VQQQQEEEEEEGERDSFRDGDSWQALVERDVATRGTVAYLQQQQRRRRI
jgi:hypothetical protein